MGRIFNDITETIGRTPLVRLNRIAEHVDAEILVKLEYMNPMASVKDRIGLAMLEAAEKAGKIDKETLIIEPTSGNTGIALAFVCAAKGYKLALTMPESMSQERISMFRLMGAQLELTPAGEGMKGAIERAYKLLKSSKKAFMPNQFTNPSNPEVHSLTTATEILEDTEGKVDFLIAGVGTGGTLTGVTRAIQKVNPDFKAIAVEPQTSPVLSGGMPGRHNIQGIGAGFIPEVLEMDLVSEVVQVMDARAYDVARQMARWEGITCGISSGAAVSVALEIAGRPENKGKRIVAILPSFAERYLSTELFQGLA